MKDHSWFGYGIMKDHSWAENAAMCAYERMKQAPMARLDMTTNTYRYRAIESMAEGWEVHQFNEARNTYQRVKRMAIDWEIHKKIGELESIQRELDDLKWRRIMWTRQWPD